MNWEAQRRMDDDADENREMYEAFAGVRTDGGTADDSTADDDEN